MIVIAIIGILAVVMVPKMSGSKDSAKATGALANGKSVEAYVISNIDKWNSNNATATAVKTLIEGQFAHATDNSKKLVNPFTGTAISIGITGGTAATDAIGGVSVTLPTAFSKTAPADVVVKAFGSSATDTLLDSTVKAN